MSSIDTLQLALNTAWVVIAAILVFFMQAGFAMLEAGLVRSKNSVNVIMKNYIDMCFGAIVFWLIGYGLMFGDSPTGWIGTNQFLLADTEDWDYTHLLFQMMFAATAATIVSGALAERIRYWAYVLSAVIISGFIYTIFGGWVWNDNGWLAQLGFIDFAGSTVVHSVGGWCALAGVIVLGPRLGRYGRERRNAPSRLAAKIKTRSIPGHSLPLAALGGFILWIGWFGFNGGSGLEANAELGKIVLVTHLAGSAGVVGGLFMLALFGQPLTMTATVNSGLAGLVSSCAGAALMEPTGAIVTGFVAGILVVLGMALLTRLKLDDAVGAVSVHGIAGIWGTLAVALFNPEYLLDVEQLAIQALGVGVAFLWTFPLALAMFWMIGFLMSLRVSSVDEQRGLDFTEHYEVGYPEFQRELLHSGKE